MLDDQLVGALDAQLVAPAAHALDGVIESVVARHRRDVVARQVAETDGGQDPGEDGRRAFGGGGLGDGRQDGAKVGFEAREAGPAEDERLEIELEVEAGQLGGDARVVEAGEDLHGHGRRAPESVDEDELLLGPDPAHAGLEEPLVQHPLERLEIAQEGLHVGAMPFSLSLRTHVLAAHTPSDWKRT